MPVRLDFFSLLLPVRSSVPTRRRPIPSSNHDTIPESDFPRPARICRRNTLSVSPPSHLSSLVFSPSLSSFGFRPRSRVAERTTYRYTGYPVTTRGRFEPTKTFGRLCRNAYVFFRIFKLKIRLFQNRMHNNISSIGRVINPARSGIVAILKIRREKGIGKGKSTGTFSGRLNTKLVETEKETKVQSSGFFFENFKRMPNRRTTTMGGIAWSGESKQ